MARRGENIYFRKDGRWEGRLVIGKTQKGRTLFRSIYGSCYHDVKNQLTLLKAQQLNPENAQSLSSWGDGTLSDWMDHWLEAFALPFVKQTTYQFYQRCIENYLRPQLGHYKMSKLHREHIQAMVNTLKKRLSPGTLHGISGLLKRILKCAWEEHLIPKSPHVHIRLPKFSRKKPRVLTQAEQKRMEQAFRETDCLEYIACLYSGLRVGELCALKYKDIDFETSTLTASRSVKRISCQGLGGSATSLVIGDTKTADSNRRIPIPYFLTEQLRQRKEQSQAASGDFIFQNTRGGAADPRTLQRRLERLTQGLQISGVHMHTLRHTFAMHCLEQGLGYKALSELLGHSSSAVTIKCYDNCTEESKQKMWGLSPLAA